MPGAYVRRPQARRAAKSTLLSIAAFIAATVAIEIPAKLFGGVPDAVRYVVTGTVFNAIRILAMDSRSEQWRDAPTSEYGARPRRQVLLIDVHRYDRQMSMSDEGVPARPLRVGDLCCSPVLQAELQPDEALVLAGALKVLADPARLRLLSLIRSAEGGRAMTSVLADRLGLTQPTVTHHLVALFDAGFLERERDGRQTWYWVNAEGLQAIRQLLDPSPARQLLMVETSRK
nr:metalloregulator ArsR/SmtB family transcription factor [Propionicimonas sp.]